MSQVKKNILGPDPAGDRTRIARIALYRVAIKAGLYSTAVQVLIYLDPVTFSPTKLGFVPEVPGHRE